MNDRSKHSYRGHLAAKLGELARRAVGTVEATLQGILTGAVK